ncbi:membrane protein [Streptococcus canis]|nr:membrane protein [Streptococcus canis]
MTWLMIFYIIGVYLRRTNLDALKINYLMLTYVLSLVATYTMTFMVGNIWYW